MAKLVDQLYSVMQGMEGRLGGGEGVQGIYGSITQQGMQRVLDCLHHSCGLGPSSTLVDIGAGLGRPLLHAQLQHQVAHAYGVESDPVKCSKAATFMRQSFIELVKRGGLELAPPRVPVITCALIEQIASLEPCTHAYSFWEGVPVSGKQAFGRLFAAARTMQGVAVVQRAFRGQDPALAMAELGFGPLQLIKTLPVKMSGSGRSFTAYVFLRPSPKAQQLLRVPAPPAGVTLSPPSKKEAAAAAAAGATELAGVQGSAVKPARGSRVQQESTDAASPPRLASAQAAAAGAAGSDGCSSPQGAKKQMGASQAAVSAVSDDSCILVVEGSSQEEVQQQQEEVEEGTKEQQQQQGGPGRAPVPTAAAAVGAKMARAAAGARSRSRPQGSAPAPPPTAVAEAGSKAAAADAAGGTPGKGRAGYDAASAGDGSGGAAVAVGGPRAAAGEEGSCSGLVQLILDDSWEANSPSKRLTLGSLTSPGKRLCTLGADESSRDSCDSVSTYNLRPKRLPFSRTSAG